jgi:hypothetical protein
MMNTNTTRKYEVGWRTYPTSAFAVGDRVAYAVQFLRSICESHGEMAHARGTVTGLQPFGDSGQLVIIHWDAGYDMPGKVNSFNLAKVGPNPRFCNID